MNTLKLLLLLLFATATVVTQEPASKITPAESEEAIRLARDFSDDMLKTKDLKQLTPKYFVSDYARRALLNERVVMGKPDLVSMILSRKTAKGLSETDVRRFIEEENTFSYLFMLDSFSKFSSTSPKEDPQPFPKEITKILRSDKFLKVMIDSKSANSASDDDDESYYASSPERFRRLLALYERLNPLLRNQAAKMNAGYTKDWEETMTDFGSRFDYFKPSADACDDECFGFPKGTRVITINVPVFQLAMVKVGPELKIVRAICYMD